jgi:hypothetical protein
VSRGAKRQRQRKKKKSQYSENERRTGPCGHREHRKVSAQPTHCRHQTHPTHRCAHSKQRMNRVRAQKRLIIAALCQRQKRGAEAQNVGQKTAQPPPIECHAVPSVAHSHSHGTTQHSTKPHINKSVKLEVHTSKHSTTHDKVQAHTPAQKRAATHAPSAQSAVQRRRGVGRRVRFAAVWCWV